jgi:hypothetical protein
VSLNSFYVALNEIVNSRFNVHCNISRNTGLLVIGHDLQYSSLWNMTLNCVLVLPFIFLFLQIVLLFSIC